MKNSIVIAEDQILISEALTLLVNAFTDFEVLYCCENGLDLIEKLKNEKVSPKIVLMDINMPRMNGIEATKELKIKFPEIKVLALTVEDDDEIVIKMMRAGAVGYLLKNVDKHLLRQALIEIVEKGYSITPEVAQILTKPQASLTLLKDHEIQVIRYIAEGYTYKEIGDKIFKSAKTVEKYRDSIYEKLNLNRKMHLIMYAVEKKIIDWPFKRKELI